MSLDHTDACHCYNFVAAFFNMFSRWLSLFFLFIRPMSLAVTLLTIKVLMCRLGSEKLEEKHHVMHDNIVASYNSRGDCLPKLGRHCLQTVTSDAIT